MTLVSDHVSPATGLTVTVNISKAGGSFAAAGGTVSEIANGFYKIALTTTDTNTEGDLAYRCSGTAADDTAFIDQVIDPYWLLKADWAGLTGEAARSMLNALRFLRNKWSVSDTTLTVTKEDDSTSAWTSTLTTNASAEPITSSDPS